MYICVTQRGVRTKGNTFESCGKISSGAATADYSRCVCVCVCRVTEEMLKGVYKRLGYSCRVADC